MTFGIQMQTFPSKCNTRKLQKKPETQLRKLISTTKATMPINTMKWKRSCNQFRSFISEPYLSTRSMKCMHLKKFKVFSRLRRRETYFRHAQGNQRASSLTGSIDIFQNTIITQYEVDCQNTVNRKLGEQTVWFWEVIKEFYHYFRRN